MPSHKTHRKVDRLVLREEFPEIHWFKDKPYKYLGPHHRKVRHDLATDMLIGALYGPRGFLSALMHDAADFGMTAARRKLRNNKQKHKNR
jgi:hypothetical protein